MEANIVSLLWHVDKVLIAAALILTAGIIVFVFVQKKISEKNQSHLNEIRKSLHLLTLQGEDAISKAVPGIVENVGLDEFVEIAQKIDSFIPLQISGDFRKSFLASGKIDALEQEAGMSAHKWLRIKALIGLGLSGSGCALGLASKALYDKDPDVSYYAMLALGYLKTKEAARALIDFIPKGVYSGQKIASLLADFPVEIVDELIRATETQKASVRFWAARILSHFKDSRCFEGVAALVGDDSADVRAASCLCLGELKDARAGSALAGCLNDPVWFVRLQAVRALYKIFQEASLRDIAGHLGDENWLVRDAIKRIIAAHPDASLPYLEKFWEEQPGLAADYLYVLESSGGLAALLQQLICADAARKEKALSFVRRILHAGGDASVQRSLGNLSEEVRGRIRPLLSDS